MMETIKEKKKTRNCRKRSTKTNRPALEVIIKKNFLSSHTKWREKGWATNKIKKHGQSKEKKPKEVTLKFPKKHYFTKQMYSLTKLH